MEPLVTFCSFAAFDSRNSSWDTIPFSARPSRFSEISANRVDLTRSSTAIFYSIDSAHHRPCQSTSDAFHTSLHRLLWFVTRTQPEISRLLSSIIEAVWLYSADLQWASLKCSQNRMRILAQTQQPREKNTGCLNWRRKLAYSSASLKSILSWREYL